MTDILIAAILLLTAAIFGAFTLGRHHGFLEGMHRGSAIWKEALGVEDGESTDIMSASEVE